MLLKLLQIYRLWWFKRRYVDGHHPANGDGHSIRYKVTPKISFEIIMLVCLFVFSAAAPIGPSPPHSRGFYMTKNGHTTAGRTPLDEWSACRREFYLTTHNNPNRLPSPRGIQTQNLRRRAGSVPRLRPDGKEIFSTIDKWARSRD